jgi:hypothetical protein
MTTTLALGFDPIWSNFNIFGVSAGGAQLFSTDSLNPSVQKFIFSDPAGIFPYTDPILFDANGNAPGPFYFLLDSLNPTSLYNLLLKDAQGNTIWEVLNYYPSLGSGGSVTTAINLDNLIVNNVMWRNVGVPTTGSATPISITNPITAMAPGVHDGLSAEAGIAQPYGPDIYLIKTNATALETVTFVPFVLGSAALTPDVTPLEYVNSKVTGAGTETYRYFLYPINAKAQSLSGQPVTFTIWAQGVSGTQTILLEFAQFFGSGAGASPTVVTPIQTFALSNSWAKYTVSVTLPSAATNNLGPCRNDGIFLRVSLPTTTTYEINFTKPSLYLGNVAPATDFINYDTIDAAINTPRTGDIRTSLNNFLSGYVNMNDGTIGSPSSLATTRASSDTFPLYNLLWNSIINAWAPVTGGRGATAVLDFVANKPIALTKALGRVFAGTLNTEILQNITVTAPAPPTTSIGVTSSVGFGLNVPVIFVTNGTLAGGLTLAQGSTTNSITYYANIVDSTHISVSLTPGGSLITITAAPTGATNTVQVTPYQLGQYLGEELHTLSTAELPAHTHPAPSGANNFMTDKGTGFALSAGNRADFQPATGSTGSGVAHNILQPTTYMNVFIKL